MIKADDIFQKVYYKSLEIIEGGEVAMFECGGKGSIDLRRDIKRLLIDSGLNVQEKGNVLLITNDKEKP